VTPEQAKAYFSNFRDKPFRPHQAEAIEFVLNRSVAPVVALDAPTGAGKSLIGMTAARMAGNAIYIVHSLQLGRQLAADFPEAAVLEGRSNYSCPQCKGDDCAQGRVLGCQHSGCPYKLAKAKAETANIAIMNYPLYLLLTNFTNTFADKRLVVCDEADRLPELLPEFCSPGISGSIIKSLNLKPPQFASTSTDKGLDRWKDWARMTKAAVVRAKSDLARALQGGVFARGEILRKARRLDALKSLIARLTTFESAVDTSWLFVVEKSYRRGFPDSWAFKPTWITENLATGIFWKHARRFLLMSATLSPPALFPKLHGVSKENVEYWPMPSPFDPKRRRVYRAPVGNMSAKVQHLALDAVCAEMTDIMARHHNVKGLINGVSYDLCRKIKASVGSPRIIFHENGADKEAIVAEYLTSSAPLVLLSPSCERGVNLPDDLCRFIIWAKAPWLYLGDKVLASRANSGAIGKLWFVGNMLGTTVQGGGRAMRSASDWCYVYLLDSSITDNLLKSGNAGLTPAWFREAIYYGPWRNDRELIVNSS